jgi:hypothetical protein
MMSRVFGIIAGLLLFVLFPMNLAAQNTKAPDNILTGKWVGTFTQDKGGQRVDFEAVIFFEQKGNVVTGKSLVYDGDIHAEMKLTGKLLSGKLLKYQETSIAKQETRPQMEWCIKKCDLSLKYTGTEWVLEGLWEGVTSFGNCVPGRVFLRKPSPRA